MKTKAGRPKLTKGDQTHDSYLAALPEDKRAALERLRRAIRAAVPQAEECISYGVPAFRLKGRFLVAYGAAKNHCAFYPGAIVESLQDELAEYETSKGTIRFPAEKPLPAALVKRLVRGQMTRKAMDSE